jgi:nicotinate-nucleotide adenylyltransferase
MTTQTTHAVRPLRLGILGGTFDPPHRGHVALGQLFAIQLELDELLWIPTGMSWQKAADITPAIHRLAMTELAAATMGGLATKVSVSRMEVDRQGPSYTIDTVRALRQQVGPTASLAWLMGADQLLGLHSWHGWQALLNEVHLCVATRPGFDLHALHPEVQRELDSRLAPAALIQSTPSGHMWVDQTLAVDLSSTELRRRLAHGDAPPDLLPAGVASYIQQHDLYRPVQRPTH